MTTGQIEVSYHNDVFFKYALSREDEDSKYIRHSIIEAITGIKPKDSVVLNPELLSDIQEKKAIVLDVHVKDEQGYEYDIEMQIGGKITTEMKRFELYGSRILSNQLKKGEDYQVLKPVYQIIFIDIYDSQDKKQLITPYQMRDVKGKVEHANALLHRIYIHLPAINQIAEERGIKRLTAFEKVCYLFKNGESRAILELEEGLVKKLMEKHTRMKAETSIWTAAEVEEIGKARYQNMLNDYYEIGIKDGLEKGMKDGKLEGVQFLVHNQIESKYEVDAHEWIQTLTLDQLTMIANNILTCETYEDLKASII